MFGYIKFKLENTDRLKQFLKESSYGETIVMIIDNRISFVSHNVDLYAEMYFRIQTNSGIENLTHFKLPNQRLLKILVDSYLTITFGDSMVELKFENDKGKKIRGYKIPHKMDDISSIIPKLELIEEMTDEQSFVVTGFGFMNRIIKAIGGQVKFESNVCSVSTPNVQVYKELESPKFNILSNLYQLLFSTSSKMYNIANLVGVRDNEHRIIILANKDSEIRPYQGIVQISDYEYMMKQGASTKISFELSEVITLSKNAKLTTGTFYIDFDKKESIFIDGEEELSSPITITDIKSTIPDYLDSSQTSISTSSLVPGGLDTVKDKKKLPKIKIPAEVLTKVLSKIPIDSVVTLSIKKDNLVIDVQGLYVAFAKVFIDE